MITRMICGIAGVLFSVAAHSGEHTGAGFSRSIELQIGKTRMIGKIEEDTVTLTTGDFKKLVRHSETSDSLFDSSNMDEYKIGHKAIRSVVIGNEDNTYVVTPDIK